ncbi:exodeoxyribonuclease III [Streptomyces alkaliterrae]|uniref:Exodeoxyribonuclease III n=1 Tax=Streptomyces alkaliterrae TaxID=2213162 RepID=A0A5P0YX07_9ACTN|nr:exodeoxyribonuclease III [Streptomyces alkaliterrae]MBB1262064.1 exodeoxyribonuclease III [Streptomyces alkaliterrae]MQS04821.1 exodeoxyribonuclease III [Streptomyces alkaliterrae]
MRIATWNINGINTRLERLLDWLKSSNTDVLCLQELKCPPEQFPEQALADAGYQAAFTSAGRWNGVAVLSRVGLDDPVTALTAVPEYEGVAEPRAVSATCGGVRVWSVYVPNGRELSHPHYTYKLQWLAALRETVAAEMTDDAPYAVLGDFNIAPTDADVWDINQFQESTHVSQPERDALTALTDTGLTMLDPRPLKYDVAFTFWDYRQLCFPKNRGMRIDHILGNAPFTAAVKDTYVDREARKGKSPSDHAPVVADLSL